MSDQRQCAERRDVLGMDGDCVLPSGHDGFHVASSGLRWRLKNGVLGFATPDFLVQIEVNH